MSEATQHTQQRPLGSRNPFRRPDEPLQHNQQAEGAATDTSQIDLMTSDFASTGISHPSSPQAQSTDDQRRGDTLAAAATSSQQQTMPAEASQTTHGMSTAPGAFPVSGLSTSAIDAPSNLGSQDVPSATYEAAPFPMGHAGSSASNARGSDYPEPTSGSPVPGRPHLRDGKLLVMPPTWEGCSKCESAYVFSLHECLRKAVRLTCSVKPDQVTVPDTSTLIHLILIRAVGGSTVAATQLR